MKYGNCVIWAIIQKLKQGGTIRVERLPPYKFVPRAWYSPNNKDWYRYGPVKPVVRPTKFQKLFPYHVLIFRGKVIKSSS